MIASRAALLLVAGLLAVAPLAACKKRSSGPDLPKAEQKALEAAKNPVNILDPKLRDRVASELYSRKRLADGRLEIAVNLRNRTKKPLQIQARTVFKDANGISVGDETAWENLFLTAQQAMTYRTESRTKEADLFTVEVRLP